MTDGNQRAKRRIALFGKGGVDLRAAESGFASNAAHAVSSAEFAENFGSFRTVAFGECAVEPLKEHLIRLIGWP